MRTVVDQQAPYTACMFRAAIALTMAFALAACGLKSDLYLPPETPAESAVAPVAADADQIDADQADKGGRKTIPATPDPSLSR